MLRLAAAPAARLAKIQQHRLPKIHACAGTTQAAKLHYDLGIIT
jgi:hypothetical protein